MPGLIPNPQSRLTRRLSTKQREVETQYASPVEPSETGIPYNGAGWEKNSGWLRPSAILFVRNPTFLELDISTAFDLSPKVASETIRAKIGLEYLERESVAFSGSNCVIRFKGPQRRELKNGIQPVFLVAVPKEQLAAEISSIRLHRIRWRNGAQK